MYTHYLRDKDSRIVLMRNGEPFLYTTEWTARLGAKYLGVKNKQKYKVTKLDAQLR